MRFGLIILLISTNVTASTFWHNIREGESNKYNESLIKFEGILTYSKKYIRARDNFFKLKIKDPDGKKYIEVKLYTIKRLKRINDFKCKEGQSIRIQGHLRVKIKKDRIGFIKIEKPAKEILCKDF